MKSPLTGTLTWFYLSGHWLSKDFVLNSVITFFFDAVTAIRRCPLIVIDAYKKKAQVGSVSVLK